MSVSPGDRPRILVVDDEPSIRNMLADFLSLEGYEVETAEDGSAAMGVLGRQSIDLVLSDLMMPRMGGIALLDEISKSAPRALTVIMTGFGTVESAIDAMKRGAYDYVLKPFKLEQVIHVVERGLEKQRIVAENMRLRETVSLYKVSEAIAASLSLEQVLDTLGRGCLEEVGADLVLTFLTDGEGKLFERQRLCGAVPEGASLGTLDAAAVAAHLARDGHVLENGSGPLRFFSDRPDLPLTSSIAVPLRIQKGPIGFVWLSRFASLPPGSEGPASSARISAPPSSADAARRFDEGERKLLALIASRTAVAIENARLYEDLQSTFQQTIEGLAKAIDKMDRYTAGHSERVARYSVFLGREVGLGTDELGIVRHSALMHDIGKLGCVLNLNKPGKLTNDEYETFKQHPAFGRDILDPIRFLHPLIPGVYLHHERWDGRGYPLKLQGVNIPIMARIISVADTYDAMTSDRSYRRSLPHEVSIAEIERCAGSQFDPDIAQTFTTRIDGFREDELASGRVIPE